MYLEHFHLNTSPFSEDPDPEIFFPEAGRAEILSALSADIAAGKPLIKVIGSEGSGKTMLCRRLLKQLPGQQYDIIYIDNPVGSFDDLLHVVCLDLGMDPATVPDRNMLAELRSLLVARKENGRQAILIIDEAEKLFLAALERLMRAICEAGIEHNLHVLLVGRPSLEANLDQLTVYCSDVDIKSGYTLQPFTEEETGQYLNFRLMAAGLPQDSREEIFTDGAVNKIYESAQGNPRLINILAEEALQASCTDKSFLVLLDHVSEKGSSSGAAGFTRVVPPLFQKKKVVFVAVGALALVLLLFFMLNGGNEKNNGIVAIPGHQVEAPPAPGEQETVPNPAAASTGVVDVVPPEEVAPRVAEETAEPPVEQQAPPAAAAEEEIVNLQPDHVKVAPAVEANETGETGAAEIRVRPVEVHTAAATVPVARGDRDGEQLFQSRIRASAKWLASAYHNRYTVQLMMLASEQAAANIKNVLTEDDYFAIKDNLYILTKKTSPPTLFVFYGTYDSMEQARQARNNMPLFLRKHHPYALSINDAMKKTED